MEILAKKGHISSFLIDEAHTVEVAGRSFRPEFIMAVESILTLISMMPRPIPWILLSAVIHKLGRDMCTSLMGDMETHVIHGRLSCRGTTCKVITSGNPGATLKKSSQRDLNSYKYKQ